MMAGYLTIFITLAVILTMIYYVVKLRKNKERQENRRKYPRNTVILHQWERGSYAPSVSCFPLKLETYLRMAKIPYKNDFTNEFSSKSKMPWITYNGEDVADSQFCIEYLNGIFNKDLNSHLTLEQRAVGRALRKMVEDSLYWAVCAVTFGDDLSMLRHLLPYTGLKLWIVTLVLRFRLRTQLWHQGTGRHSVAESIHIGQQDLQAISDFLGNKRFIMGDEPCEVDCAIFGMVAQCKWHQPTSPYEKMVTDDFANLSRYCDRMKERFWPDWDNCITHGGTRQATK